VDEAKNVTISQGQAGDVNNGERNAMPTEPQPETPPPSRVRLFFGSLQSRLMLLGLVVALLTIAVILGSASNATRYRDAELRRHLLEHASSMAQAINPERVKKLSFTAADRELPEFQRLRQQLRDFQTVTNWRGIWSVARRNDQLVFGPESYAEDDPLASPPGMAYQRPPAELLDLFHTKQAFVHGPYIDEYGTFVSAFAPVVDPRTGEVLMVVGLDVESTKWLAALARARWQPLLLTLPLVLIMLGGAVILWRRRQRPEEQRLGVRYAEVYIIAAFGLTLTAAVALNLHRTETHLKHQAFHAQAESQVNQIITAFTGLRDFHLESLVRTFEMASTVDRDGFRRAIEPFLRGSNLIAFEWIQPVTAGQRGEVEAWVRGQGVPDFAIWQQGPEGVKEPATDRAVFYPVMQIEPLEDKEAILGYDIGSESRRRAALEHTIATGLPSVTNPLTLLTKPEGANGGFLVLFPVVSGRPPARNLRGIVAAVVEVEPFLCSIVAARQANKPLIALEMHQVGTGHKPHLLAATARNLSILQTTPSCRLVSGAEDRSELVTIFPLFIFGQTYTLTVRPLPDFYSVHPQRAAWTTLLAGTLLTALLALFTASLLRSQATLETLVQTRTAALRQREAYLAGLLDTLGEGVFTLDLPHGCVDDRRIAYTNRAITDILGYSPEEMSGRSPRMLYPSDDGYLDQGRRLAEGITAGLRYIYTEQEMRRQDGHSVLVALHSSFLAGDGPSLTVITTLRDVTARRRAEERIRRVNRCLLSLGSDFQVNVNRLTALAGELLGGSCALSCRLVDGKLRLQGQWRLPAEFRHRDDPEGAVCGDVIRHPCGTARFIPDLRDSEYARTDPNVLACDLRSSLCHNVRCGESTVGSLCVFFPEVVAPSLDDERLLGLLAAALAVEKSRQDAEERLRNSESRYRQLVENTSDILYAIDRNGRFAYVGPQAARYGLQPERMIGEDFLLSILTEDRDHVTADFAHILETGEEIATVFRAELPSGVTPWFEARSRISRNEAGEATGISGVLRDVTEREEAKQALVQANAELERRVVERTEQLEQFFSVGLDLYCIADVDGYFQVLNHAWETTLGYSRAELQAQSFLSFVHPDDLAPTLAVGELAVQRQVTRFINRYRCKDGTYRWLEWSSIPVGNLIYGSAHDVTKQRELERHLLAAKEAAEKASRVKSDFVANMSHEIRTPLNAIIGFAQILERDASLGPRQGEQVHTILRSGQHLLKLINDILDISKIEAGSLIVHTVDFCFEELLQDLEMMFRSRAEAKGIWLAMERGQGGPRYLAADEAKLRQVLINLMGNAVKLTQTGGVTVRVRVEAPMQDAMANGKAHRLVVEVEDTGPGIPVQDRSRIFDAFQQSETGKEAGGTGLGLAIAHRLVELMGGGITVESEVGKGSCFRFEVPVQLAGKMAVPPVQAMNRVAGLEPGTGPLRILVVDDVEDNRALLRALLDPVGFEVKEAANGQEALEVFTDWAPHAVLMDMRMPVMDGYETTRRIRAIAKERAVAVIAVTASAFADQQYEILATGMDGYVRKPVKQEELFAALGKSLGLRYVFAEETGKPRSTTRAITRGELASLPEELVAAMRETVENGDMVALKELIGRVEQLNAEAAHELQRLAKNYDYAKLSLLLTQ